jgi:hypothetical protein
MKFSLLRAVLHIAFLLFTSILATGSITAAAATYKGEGTLLQECQNNNRDSCDGAGYILGQIAANSRLDAQESADFNMAFENGCRLGSASSCFNLAEAYVGGRVFQSDPAKAAELFGKSCALNNQAACPLASQYAEAAKHAPPPQPQLAQAPGGAMASNTYPSAQRAQMREPTSASSPGPDTGNPHFAELDATLRAESSTWVMDRYVAGSISNIHVVRARNASSATIISANYAYTDGRVGSFKEQIVHGKLQCIEFWNFPGQCRGIGASPSRSIAAQAVEGAMSGSSGSGSSGGGDDADSENTRFNMQVQNNRAQGLNDNGTQR